MLDLQERELLLDALRPPYGFTLDGAIGTTYSLDLLSLLTVPMAFTMFSLEETADGRLRLDPTVVLESLRRNAGRIAVFCQAGQTYLPSQSSPLFGYLEKLVVEVDPGTGGVFHPKIWVLRFASPDGRVRYRLLSATRNLTFDRSWDSVVCLEGDLTDRKVAYSQNRPLGDLLARLPAMAIGRAVPESTQKVVAQLEGEVRRIKFDVPQPFDSYRFWAGGVGNRADGPMQERCDRALVVSPFCSAGTLEKLVEGAGEHILVSTPATLGCLSAKVWETFRRVTVLSDAADAEQSAEPLEGASQPLNGLHAKIFVFDQGWDATVWTGSANATDSAFERNVEFLIGLGGRKSTCGIDAVFGPSPGSSMVGDWVTDFAQPVTFAAPELSGVLEEARAAIAGAGLRVTVEAVEESRTFRLILSADADSAFLTAGVNATCWPITLKPDHARAISPPPSKLVFGPVGLDGLTSFFAFEVSQRGAQVEPIRFVLNLPIEGVPSDREERLLKSVLEDSDGVERFIGLLLASEGDPLVGLSYPGGESDAKGEGPRGKGNHLLERLVRALHRNPAQLDAVEHLVNDLAKDPDSAGMLPAGFSAIWPPILEARRRMRA